MGIEKLVALAFALATLAAGTGQLSKAVHAVQKAQIQLLKTSESSSWGQAYLLPTH